MAPLGSRTPGIGKRPSKPRDPSTNTRQLDADPCWLTAPVTWIEKQEQLVTHEMDDKGTGHQKRRSKKQSRHFEAWSEWVHSQPYPCEATQYGKTIEKERNPSVKKPL